MASNAPSRPGLFYDLEKLKLEDGDRVPERTDAYLCSPLGRNRETPSMGAGSWRKQGAPLMKLPVLAFCNGWLKVYAKVADAEADMEPIDVENGEWEVFDASGSPLDVSVQKRSTRGLWSLLSPHEETVSITEPGSVVADTDRLRALVLVYLRELAEVDQRTAELHPQVAAALPFDELIATIIQIRSSV